jgi:hypothetical protein
VTVDSVITGSNTGSFSNILMRDWTSDARLALYLTDESVFKNKIPAEMHLQYRYVRYYAGSRQKYSTRTSSIDNL